MFHIKFTVDNVFEKLVSTKKKFNDRFNGSF